MLRRRPDGKIGPAFVSHRGRNHVLHHGAAGAPPALVQHADDRRLSTFEHRLDRAVAPVAHPAPEVQLRRPVGGPGTVAHTLHTSGNDGMQGLGHANSIMTASTARLSPFLTCTFLMSASRSALRIFS